MKFCNRCFVFFLFVFIVLTPGNLFAQLGNENGQYDDVIKLSYDLLQKVNENNKDALKSSFHEGSFQTKKEFNKMLSNKNIKWAQKTILTNGIPSKNDISLSAWKTIMKETQSSSLSINVTFYFKGNNKKYSNIDDHISFNFYKNSLGEYHLNGLLFFKKDDFLNVKKLSDFSK